jgi:hypothetical protein
MGHPLRRGDPELSLPISYVTKVVVVSFLRGDVSISERRDGSVSAVSIMGAAPAYQIRVLPLQSSSFDFLVP